MVSRAATSADTGSPGRDCEQQNKIRRSKSMSSALPQIQTPAVTRSDRLTPQEMQAQAKAAAVRAYRNDLLRKTEQETKENTALQRKQSICFKESPPVDPEYNPYGYLEDDGCNLKRYDTNRIRIQNIQNHQDSSPHRLYDPTYITTAPSSYRRLRRSRSLFSVTQNKINRTGMPERSLTVSGGSLKSRRSMSFLRGGTDFMPASYRREFLQPPVRERKSLYYLAPSSLRDSKQPQMDAVLDKPRSLRMKVRKISATVLNSVRRAFQSGSARDEHQEMPAQHVVSNRPFFGEYATISDHNKQQASQHNFEDVFMSRVNSGAPILRRVPSSIGYPSRTGSIRIITPPTRSTTPGSTSGNTWATSTTASTLRSGAGSKRLSVIPEATPKGDGQKDIETTPTRSRTKALDKQRVYSAFLRVSRAKNSETRNEMERVPTQFDFADLPRSPSAQSHSTTASTIKKSISLREEVFDSSDKVSRSEGPLVGNKENVSPSHMQSKAQKPINRTHITIGPRIILYPPPSANIECPATGESSTASSSQDKDGANVRSVRHVHSTFFPYSIAQPVGGSTPSPYKRATAMSPDTPSIYSRTTSGDTPKLTDVNDNTPRPSISENTGNEEFVQLGRKVSLVRMNRKDAIHHSAPTPTGTPGSYYTAKTRKEENIPFSTYLPGLMRPGEVTPSQEETVAPSTSAATFGLSFLRSRQLSARRDTGMVEAAVAGEKESRRKHRVLTAKKLQDTVPSLEQSELPPLSGIDSNTGTREGKRRNWSIALGKRNQSQNQASTTVSAYGNDSKSIEKGEGSAENMKDVVHGLFTADENKNPSVAAVPKPTGNDILQSALVKNAPKFSFEINDDKAYSFAATPSIGAEELKFPKLKPHGPRAMLKSEQGASRNASFGSNVGAFL